MTQNYIEQSQNSGFFAGSSNTEDHDQQFHQFFISPSYHHSDASSSSHSFHIYFNPTQDQPGYNYHTQSVNHAQQQLFDQGNKNVVSFGGSYDTYQVENKVGICHASKEANSDDDNISSAKWVSSKMKMKKFDHIKGGEREGCQKLPFKNSIINSVESNKDLWSNCSSYNSITPIRVCADCNTTKTPLWRSGPKGPKSLCNACGIRQRKARRALAEANGTPLSPQTTTKTSVGVKVKHQKSEKSKNNYRINGISTVPFKKRCKGSSANNASLAVGSSSDQEPAPVTGGFEDFLINLTNKLAFHHVFPQDEKEAAILLMALSYGLVHG